MKEKEVGKKKKKNQNKTNTLNTFFRLLTCLSTNIILMAEMWTRFPLIRSGPYLIVDTARGSVREWMKRRGRKKKKVHCSTRLRKRDMYGYLRSRTGTDI